MGQDVMMTFMNFVFSAPSTVAGMCLMLSKYLLKE